MNGQTQQKIFNGLGIAFAVLVVFLLVRVFVIIEPSLSDEDTCVFEFGENWTYEETSYFGEACIKLDYENLEVVDRVKVNWDEREMEKKYCKIPKFWDVTKWWAECEKLE